MIYEATIEIERPIDEVFEVTTCMRRCVVWRPTAVNSKMDSDEPAHVGSTFTQQWTFLNYTSESKSVISEFEAPHLFAFKDVEGSEGYHFRLTFKPTASGTLFHVAVELNKLPMPLWILSQIGIDKRIAERAMRNELQQLKMLLENDVDLWALTPA